MEILFKAKRADNGKWVYSQLIYDAIDMPRIVQKDSSGKGLRFVNVIPETACQFTGNQIEGVNLFKGDKIKSFHFRERQSNHYLEHIVLWNNEYSCWMASSDGTTEIKNGNVFLYIFLKNAIEPKITGNIYDDGK